MARLRVHGEVVAGLGTARPARRRDGPRGGRERRDRALLQRHVLRQSPQPDPARAAARHARRLGDPAPARARPRLGDREAGRARHPPPGGGGHLALQGQRPGESAGSRGADEDLDNWREILPPTPLRPHTLHRFDEIAAAGPLTHVRLNIHPDGGVARLRLFGTLAG